MTEDSDASAEDGPPFAETDRLSAILVDDGPDDAPEAMDLENERRVAIFDLLEANRFALTGAVAPGPYALRLRREEEALAFEIAAQDGAALARPRLPVAQLTPLVRDYAAICNDYRDAIARLAPSQIEALDAERRQTHDEASDALRRLLAPEARVDLPTARRLFTLICAVLRDF